MTPGSQAPWCVLFDLDNTLLCAASCLLRGARIDGIVRAHQWADHAARLGIRDPVGDRPGYFIHLRPHARALLHRLHARPDVRLGLWTAASDLYARTLLEHLLDPAAFDPLLTGTACTVVTRDKLPPQTQALTRATRLRCKDLRALSAFGVDLQRTVIIDDRPHTILPSPSFAIGVPAYMGQTHDPTLAELSALLDDLLDAPSRDAIDLPARTQALGWPDRDPTVWLKRNGFAFDVSVTPDTYTGPEPGR